MKYYVIKSSRTLNKQLGHGYMGVTWEKTRMKRVPHFDTVEEAVFAARILVRFNPVGFTVVDEEGRDIFRAGFSEYCGYRTKKYHRRALARSVLEGRARRKRPRLCRIFDAIIESIAI